MQGNSVHIRCDGCGARFRFDRTLIAGFRGARLRCRRCGHPIDVSIPGVPLAPQEQASPGFLPVSGTPSLFPAADPPPPGSRRRVAARSARSATLAVPVEGESSAADPMPDNLVDLLRIRASQRPPIVSSEPDPPDRIARFILASVPLYPEEEPEVPSSKATAHQVMKIPPPDGRTGVLGGVFRWGDPAPPRRIAHGSSAHKLILFAMFGTAIACIGFSLILYFVH